MRRSKTVLTVALLLTAAATAHAQVRVGDQGTTAQVPLARGELLAQVTGRAIVRPAPDLATFLVPVPGKGPTEAAARSDADALANQVIAKLVAAGIDRSSFETVSGPADRSSASDDMSPPQTPPPPSFTTACLLTIKLTDMTKLSAVYAVIAADPILFTGQPAFSLRDDSAARRTAITTAIAKARQDADTYAAALGTRVLRVVRVYDLSISVPRFPDLAQVIRQLDKKEGDQIVVDVQVGLDVALAGSPK